MKKILLFSILVAVIAVSCKKNPANPSITVTVAFPTVTPIQLYFSVPMGSASLPAASAIATAYDSVYNESCSLVVIDTAVHTAVPGLYQAAIIAKNKYGYITSVPYYVAVTQFSAGYPNLAGTYVNGASTNVVTTLNNGFYEMNNFDGVTDSAAVFAATTDTTIAFAGAGASTSLSITGSWDAVSSPPSWPGSYYYGLTGSVSYATGDTTLSYNSLSFSKP